MKIRLEMKNYNMILIEKLQISALSSGKIDKYEYLTDEEILHSNQQQIIEQAKFTYSPLRKAFEKQAKIIKGQGEKQIKPINDNKKQLTDTTGYYKNKLQKELEIFNKKINFDDLDYIVISTGVETNFSISKNPVEFFDDIRTDKITIEETKNKQKNLLNI